MDDATQAFDSVDGSGTPEREEEQAVDSSPGAGSGRKVEVGSTFANRYQVEEELGMGAQARVYRVLDLELDEFVALKVLADDTTVGKNAAQQFKDELKLARRVVHPNVCRLYDFGRWGDVLYVTMELIPGTTLVDRIRDDSLGDLEARLAVFRDMLVGLRAAHALGIIHRDIKPQNIMVTPEGQAVVMDFGLAGEESEIGRARGGTVLGTPAYIAPERLRGTPADQRSDIYSAGIVLFELATGKKPFLGNVSEIIQKHLHEEPLAVSSLVPDIPESVDRAVDRMLRKAPEERFASVDQVLESLAEIRSDSTSHKVVIGEGDDDLRDLLHSMLVSYGFEVTSTVDTEEVVEVLLRERPDVIVLDYEMPKIDGFRITEMLRNYAHLEGVPIYILSRFRDASYLAYARQLGITKLMRRPIAVRAFAEELTSALENA